MLMKIAVIIKAGLEHLQTYTSYKNKVTYHPENLFLSTEDKSALEYALQLIEVKGGLIDAYSFEQGEVADRILHEAMALGANTATKIVTGDLKDPMQQNYLVKKLIQYLKNEGKKYDLIITGYSSFSQFAAIIADKLKMNYYDQLTNIDVNFNYEMKLEKGILKGQCELPMVITNLSSINTPRLANFSAVKKAINSKITEVSFKKLNKQKVSQIKVETEKSEKMIFNLDNDPDATSKLITLLERNGIMR